MTLRYEKVKAGIIGWGENTLLIADILTKYSKFIDFVAFSSSHRAGRDYVTNHHGVKQVYSHHSQMMDLHEIDAVILLGPKKEYPDQIIDSLQAGYHVLYELPSLISESLSITLLKVIDRHPSQICMPVLPHRHDSPLIRIKESISSESLGDILAVEYRLNFAKSKSSYEEVSDIVADLMLEGIDKVKWILGTSFKRVLSISQSEDYKHYSILCDNGIEVNMTANRLGHAPDGNTLRIIGSLGEIVVNDPELTIQRAKMSEGNLTTMNSEVDKILPYQAVLNAFVYNIQEKIQGKFKISDLQSHMDDLKLFYQ